MPFRRIVLFELALGVAAVLIGWSLGRNPLDKLLAEHDAPWWSAVKNLSLGLVLSLPLMGALLLLDRYPLGPLRELKKLTEDQVLPLFQRFTLSQFLVISLGAGVCEELLFRGLLQAGLREGFTFPYGPAVACIVASILFGVAHYLSHTYAVLAAVFGIYTGFIFETTGALLAPMVIHTLYDFFALAYFVKWKSPGSGA